MGFWCPRLRVRAAISTSFWHEIVDFVGHRVHNIVNVGCSKESHSGALSVDTGDHLFFTTNNK